MTPCYGMNKKSQPQHRYETSPSVIQEATILHWFTTWKKNTQLSKITKITGITTRAPGRPKKVRQELPRFEGEIPAFPVQLTEPQHELFAALQTLAQRTDEHAALCNQKTQSALDADLQRVAGREGQYVLLLPKKLDMNQLKSDFTKYKQPAHGNFAYTDPLKQGVAYRTSACNTLVIKNT
jgi:hypothetical protein